MHRDGRPEPGPATTTEMHPPATIPRRRGTPRTVATHPDRHRGRLGGIRLGAAMSATGQWPASLHEHIDWENEVAYDRGYRDGLRDAVAVMDCALREAVYPAPASAKAVVEQLIRVMGQVIDA